MLSFKRPLQVHNFLTLNAKWMYASCITNLAGTRFLTFLLQTSKWTGWFPFHPPLTKLIYICTSSHDPAWPPKFQFSYDTQSISQWKKLCSCFMLSNALGVGRFSWKISGLSGSSQAGSYFHILGHLHPTPANGPFHYTLHQNRASPAALWYWWSILQWSF